MRSTAFSAMIAILFCVPLCGVYGQIGGEAVKRDERVQLALDTAGIKYTVDADGDFRATFRIDSTRTQAVLVRSSTMTYGQLEIREIWSYAYRSESDQFPGLIANNLLEASWRSKLGAWTKKDKIAVFVVKVSANTRSEQLVLALNAAATSADKMEAQLSGTKDEF